MRAAVLAAFLLFATSARADQAGLAVWKMTPVNTAIYPAVNAPGAIPAVNAPGAIVGTIDGSVYVTTDNVDARACALAGVMLPNGTVVGNGGIARVKITAAGGQPANGATVWLAAAQEARGGAAWDTPFQAAPYRGMFTATQPPVDQNPEDIYPLMRQNLAPGGVVVDNSRYSIDHTVTIRVATASACQFANQDGSSTIVPDSTQIFRGVKMTAGSGASFTALADTPEKMLNDNETLIITYIADNVCTAAVCPQIHDTGWRIYNDSTRKGWFLDLNDNNQIFFFNDEAGGRHQPSIVGNVAPGKNIVIITRHDGLFHLSTNGNGTPATITDVGVDAVTGRSFTIDYAFGVTTSIVKLGRAMSDAEIANVGAGNTGTADQMYQLRFDADENHYAPDPTMVSDPSCQWYIDFNGYTGGTLAAVGGPAGSGFTWTTNGTPIIRTMTFTWFGSPATWVQDGDTPAYDSRHSIRTSGLARIRITTQNQYEWAMATPGIVGEDVDNNDEAAVWTTFATSGLVSWSPVAGASVGAQGRILSRNGVWFDYRNSNSNPTWTNMGLGPYTTDFGLTDLFLREATFPSGAYLNRIGLLTHVDENGVGRDTSIVDTSMATSYRLTIVGDHKETGHEQDFLDASPAAGAAVNRMRAVFPGKITCECYAQHALARAEAWGGTMETYALRVVDMSRLGNAATRKILIDIGQEDWASAWDTAANTAARLGRLLDWIHAIDPTVPILWAVPYCTPAMTVANGNGETLQQFHDAMVAVVASRSWVTQIDLTSPNAITWMAHGGDYLVEVGAGQVALAANFRAALEF